MKYSQQIGLFAALLLIGSCFLPWIEIPSLHKTLNGINGKVNENITFGKPFLVHFFCCIIATALFLIKRVQAKLFNIFFCFFNLGWALKNVILFNSCRSAECPIRKPGLYLVLLFAITMQIMALLPRLKLESKN
jgi:hypothetical protein